MEHCTCNRKLHQKHIANEKKKNLTLSNYL